MVIKYTGRVMENTVYKVQKKLHWFSSMKVLTLWPGICGK